MNAVKGLCLKSRFAFGFALRRGRASASHQAAKPHLFSPLLVILLTLIAFTATATVKAQQMQVPETGNYNKFSHSGAYHARLPCSLCHRRENNSARPTMPGSSNHSPCAGCHVKQFADTGSPICTICHTSPPSAGLKAFPRLSSFAMRFDHARHVKMNNLGCASCHRSSRGGVAMTIPAGFQAHGSCFQCHGPNAKSGERDISSCNVCHQPGRPSRKSTRAPAFAVGFSHSKHGKSADLTCNECHQVRLASARLQVSSPQPLNHHASVKAFSCMSCHNGKRAFGGDDFSVCARCHKGREWRF